MRTPRSTNKTKRRNPGFVPKVYVGPYENTTAGAWLPADTVDAFDVSLKKLLDSKPRYEEWGVFDVDGFYGFRSESVAAVRPWIDARAYFAKEGYDGAALAALMEAWQEEAQYNDYADKAAIVDAFTGADSAAALAGQYLDESGGVQGLSRETLEFYFNEEAFARDLALEHSVFGGFFFVPL